MTYKLLSTIGLAVSLAAVPRVAVAQIVLEPVVSGLDAPVGFLGVPGLTGAHVILEHSGRIRLMQDGALQNDFLDLRSVVRTGGEWGLLGLAFPADYGISRRVFVNFIDSNGNTVVARFESQTDLLHPDPATRFDLVWPGGTPYIPQPDTPMHKGGNMAFGPDGYLYIGLGDGGEGDDIYHRAQDPLSLLGKMLRIDVSVGDADPEGYDVPVDNPFAGRDDVLGEIWAFGLRNPWRWSFDDPWGGGGTGALIIADVGQDDWEEIDYEPAGAGGRNYGWRIREGAHDHLTSLPPFSWNLTDPTFEYNHEMGRAVIGGFVYRGSLLGPEYRGKYLFADFMSGDVWALDLSVDPQSGEAVASGLTGFGSLGSVRPSSFGTDSDNELYLVSHAYGTVHRLILGEPENASKDNACATPDPFQAFGGGRCANHGWMPPGFTPPADEPASPTLPASPPVPPASPAPTTCASPDPFAALGGGVCANGGWSPPSSAPESPTSPVSPPVPPASSAPTTCASSDPFAALGGGVCANGGWSPPSSAPASSTSPVPPPMPPASPAPTTCASPDPFAVFGGGVCVNGGWWPPGAVPPSSGGSLPEGSTPPPVPPPAGPLPSSSGGCSGPDPFAEMESIMGLCVNGGWIPVPR